MTETNFSPDIPAKPWRKKNLPTRILAIRLQAMGDLVITLPYLQGLKKILPEGSQLDLLTRKEVSEIPESIRLFDHVYAIGGGRNVKKQFLYGSWLLPRLFFRHYDVIIDLQNNIVTRYMRKLLMPSAWSSFDRFSPIPAGESTRLTIEAVGLGHCEAVTGFKFKKDEGATELLKNNGWDGKSMLIILNPAGAFSSRNWPIENYRQFARIWLEKFPLTQFLMIGVNFIAEKANWLKQELGERLINLIGLTSASQAFEMIQRCRIVLSEDSGLMHMAWVSGIPTLAMFGSTNSGRATPLGLHTLLLGSGDLPCGNCMLEVCKYGDTHCLTRYEPGFVFEKAIALTGFNSSKSLTG